MDALGLALGMRAENRMIRHGENQAVISASFELAPAHPAHTMLKHKALIPMGKPSS